jgi:hypothetical protein
MNELSFLVNLFLNHRLPRATKEYVAARISEIEANLTQQPTAPKAVHPFPGLPQAASTMAILARNPDLMPPAKVEVIAQTPATVAAMASREQAISESMSGKVDKVTGRPRKF